MDIKGSVIVVTGASSGIGEATARAAAALGARLALLARRTERIEAIASDMQAVLPSMRRQGAGSIVNVSSGATLATYAGSAAYTSSKAALNMLTDVARMELADAGIVVSNVLPFVTATDFYVSVKADREAATSQEAETASIAHSPHRVAAVILDVIRSGKAAADLVPKQFGGSFDG